MPTVLVAGGSGFIGSHIVDRLLDRGHDVFIYDVREPHPDTKKGYKWENIDISNFSNLLVNMRCRKFDAVYNLASVSNTMECVKDPIKATTVNCVGTTNLLEASRQTEVNHFIMASSSLISGIMDERTEYIKPLQSNHNYVTTKLFQEMLVRDYFMMYGLPYTILRYGICYGPRMTEGVVADIFIRQALKGGPITVHGDGNQWRQYVYVEDLADANVLAFNDDHIAKTFNIVGYQQVSIGLMAYVVKGHFSDVEIKFVEKRSHDLKVNFLSTAKASRALGWEAKTSLAEGVEKTIDYYRKNVITCE